MANWRPVRYRAVPPSESTNCARAVGIDREGVGRNGQAPVARHRPQPAVSILLDLDDPVAQAPGLLLVLLHRLTVVAEEVEPEVRYPEVAQAILVDPGHRRPGQGVDLVLLGVVQKGQFLCLEGAGGEQHRDGRSEQQQGRREGAP